MHCCMWTFGFVVTVRRLLVVCDDVPIETSCGPLRTLASQYVSAQIVISQACACLLRGGHDSPTSRELSATMIIYRVLQESRCDIQCHFACNQPCWKLNGAVPAACAVLFFTAGVRVLGTQYIVAHIIASVSRITVFQPGTESVISTTS
jgi:hypothetical protein